MGGKWRKMAEVDYFSFRLIVGIAWGTDGRTQYPIIELSYIPMARREMAGNPRNAESRVNHNTRRDTT
jgi:hypothetical protein